MVKCIHLKLQSLNKVNFFKLISDGLSLFQESDKIYGYQELGFMKDYHFIVTNHNYTKGFHLFIDSCTNLELGLTIIGTGNENASFPITRLNSEFSGRSSHSYGSYVQIKGNKYANKKMRITLGHVGHIPPANIFSVFTTTEGYGNFNYSIHFKTQDQKYFN
jgi:hypothetical protein